MQQHLVSSIDYPNSASISLEQARLSKISPHEQSLKKSETLLIPLTKSVTYFTISFGDNFEVPIMPLYVIIEDSLPRRFVNINSYFYVLCHYSTYLRRWGIIGYPNQDFVLVYHEIPWRKSQTRLIGQFPDEIFPVIFLHCLS